MDCMVRSRFPPLVKCLKFALALDRTPTGFLSLYLGILVSVTTSLLALAA